MVIKTWATSHNGKFEYVSLTPATLEGSLRVMRDSFFKDETVAIACDVNSNPAAKKELEELCLNAALDGVSIVCVDTTSNKVVGAAFNKLQVKTEAGDYTYFENFIKKCKEDSSKALVKFMIDADSACDLFKFYNIDCLLELMFLATLPEYRQLGIAKKLMELTIELGRTLLKGENVKNPIDDRVLTLEPVPKVVSAICTSFITQKMARNLHFTKTAEIGFDKFFYKGQTFASKVSHTPTTTLDSLKL